MSEMIHVRGALCIITEITAPDRVREGIMEAFLARLDEVVKQYQAHAGVQANEEANFYLTLTMEQPRTETIDVSELEEKK